MDYLFRIIFYIVDIGDIFVIMVRRRFLLLLGEEFLRKKK